MHAFTGDSVVSVFSGQNILSLTIIIWIYNLQYSIGPRSVGTKMYSTGSQQVTK